MGQSARRVDAARRDNLVAPVRHRLVRGARGEAERLAAINRWFEVNQPLLLLVAQELIASTAAYDAGEAWTTKPKCSICRKPRGSNPACEKCQSTRRMLKERHSPTPKQIEARDATLAQVAAGQATREAQEQARRARLTGRRVRVALVGCGKSKLDRPAKARDLYTGNLFRAARTYAERCTDEWLILSASHGVVEPDTILEPYERTLSSMRLSELEAYWRRNRSWLDQTYHGLDVEFVGLAGRDYLGGLGGLNLSEPLDGMGIGQRLKWLKEAAAGCADCSSDCQGGSA